MKTSHKIRANPAQGRKKPPDGFIKKVAVIFKITATFDAKYLSKTTLIAPVH
jgi:hypothetical protein